jgi:mRNA interferase MazF
MKTGDIILVPFPFAEFTNRKVRPCVVICTTKDKYHDLVVSAISSVVPDKLSGNEILVESDTLNSLRKTSVIKVDRIVTVKSTDVIAKIGELSEKYKEEFIKKFKNLVENKIEDQEQPHDQDQEAEKWTQPGDSGNGGSLVS